MFAIRKLAAPGGREVFYGRANRYYFDGRQVYVFAVLEDALALARRRAWGEWVVVRYGDA